MIRYPVVSGTFYPGSINKLRQMISDLMKLRLGPNVSDIDVPVSRPMGRNLAVIVPHAGYIYSGSVAVHAYVEVAKQGKPTLVVLLGPNHTGRGAKVGVWNTGYWITPFGQVQVDEEAADLLLRNCEICKSDFDSHLMEHSLEVQLPFLQYLFADFKILPITISQVSAQICQKIALGLDALASSYTNVLFVVSTDLNHYEDQGITLKKDSLAIEKIVSKDPNGLLRVVLDEDISMCGVFPVVAFLQMKTFARPRLLCHATSGDVTGELSQVVGYAGFICEPV